MTGLLQDTLNERADDVVSPAFDLDAIMADGDRRRRRRVAVAGVGIAAAAAACAALAVPVLAGTGGDDGATVLDGSDAFPTTASWAVGSRISRDGLASTDVDHPIRSYLVTDRAVVYADPDLTVRIAYGAGDEEVVGHLGPVVPDTAELVSDRNRVAFADAEDGLVVVDTATGDRWILPVEAADEALTPRPTAIEGDTVWFVDGRGSASWNVQTGEVAVRPDGARVIDAEADRLLLDDPEGGGRVVTSAGARDVNIEDFGNLSNDGALMSLSYHDEGKIFDVDSGRAVPFPHGHDWAIAYQWLDSGTVVALTFDLGGGEEKPFLTECDMTAETCRDVTPLPADQGAFQLPIGVHFEG